MKKLTLFLLALCIGIGCAFSACADSPSEPTLLHSSDKQISLSFSFEQPVIVSNSEKGSVSIAGLTNAAFSTAELPTRHIDVLLPYGTTVDSYSVTGSQFTSIENVYLPMPQLVYPLNGDDTPSFMSNVAPAENHSEGSVQLLRGFALFSIDLYPVTYSGTTLTYTENLTLDITLDTEDFSDYYQPSYIDMDMLPDDFLCEQFLSTYPLYSTAVSTAATKKTLLGTGRVDYVIITKSSLAKYFNPLISFKRSKGLSAKTVTVESIYSAYKTKGRDNAERIRLFLQDAYKYNRIRYVLLGGDADADSAKPTRIAYKSTCIVPTRLLYCSFDSKVKYIASDLYYACLDGNYDYDKDGIYGEPKDGLRGKDVDLLCDVYVGRAPVDNATEASNFVTKTIRYEKRAKNKTALMVGELLSSNYSCSATEVLNQFDTETADKIASTLHRLRDVQLDPYYVELYYDTTTFLTGILQNDSKLLMTLGRHFLHYESALSDYLNDETDNYVLTQEDIDDLLNTAECIRKDIRASRASCARRDELLDCIDDFETYISKCVGKRFGDAIENSPFCADDSALLTYDTLADTYGMDYKEEIRKGSRVGVTTKGLPSTYKTSVLYDKTYKSNGKKTRWPVSAVISMLNKSPELVNHLGHCNNTTLMKMGLKDLAKLKNSNSFFLFSQGCYPGSFDNMTSNLKYTSSDAIAEQLLLGHNRYGAVACVVNSRYGWYVKNSTQGPSQVYDRYFFHEFAKSPSTSVGALLAKAKHDVYKTGKIASQPVLRFCYYEINLLGDPEMSLFKTKATLGSTYSAAMERSMYPAVPDAVETTEDIGIPQTGDSSSLSLFIILLVVSVAGLSIMLFRRKSGRSC